MSLLAVNGYPTVKGRRVKANYIRILKRRLEISDEEWENA